MAGPDTQAFWLIALVEHARGRGVTPSALGVDAGLLADPMGMVPLGLYYDVLERASVTLDDPDLGVALGRGLDAEALGAMAFVFATAATFGEGLEQFLRFSPGGERFEIATVDGTAHLRFHPWGPPRPAHHLRASSFVVDLALNAAPMADGALKDLSAHVRVRDEARLAALREALGRPVRGGAPIDELCFDAAGLALPSRDANPAMNAFFEDYLAGRRPPEEASTVVRVCALIDARLPDGPFEIASLARALGWSTRTLQRKLRAEDTSPRALLAERRLLRAQAALDAGRSMTEAAFEAGYSEASALHRALRRRRG